MDAVEHPAQDQTLTASSHTSRRMEWLAYFAATGLAITAAVVVLQLWAASLRLPLRYGGDAVFSGAVIKGMIENGWMWVNPRLGAPGVMNLLDYPGADLVHYGLIKGLSLVSANWSIVLNAYFLLGFPLAAVSCLWAMRRLGVSRLSAVAVSVLYAVLPYHFLRGEEHLFLSAYYLVPLVMLVALSLAGGIATALGIEGLGARPVLRSKSTWFVAVVCLLVGSSGVYYAAFACFFLVLGSAIGWWRSRQLAPLIAGGVLTAVILASGLVNVAPSMSYRMTEGVNPAVAARSSADAEVYPLRITQMVLPVQMHRFPKFSRIRGVYDRGVRRLFGPLIDNESGSASLGLVGTSGFLFLLLVLLVQGRPRGDDHPAERRVSDAAGLMLGGLLLATAGGFGSIVALRLAELRAYNRIVVYVAFLALFGVAVLFDRVLRWMKPGMRRYGAPLLAVLLLVFGTWDQTTPAMVPAYWATRTSWAATGDLVRRIEKVLPAGAMVFQLPYVPFPENPPVEDMTDYDHFKPYLQSSTLRWSYGAVKGRDTAKWLKRVGGMSVRGMLLDLRYRGFGGVWVDRAGYSDRGVQVVGEFTAAVGSAPLTSGDGRYVFFALSQ
jgi:phosphoglycerol transferase